MESMKDEMDVLREVATIASGHGSKALSVMINKRIKLNLPVVKLLDDRRLQEEISPSDVVLTVRCRILSGIEGEILFVLDEKSAFNLVSMCYKDKDNIPAGLLTEVGLSAIKEISHVVIGSYVGALSMLLNLLVVPSIPMLISGPLSEVLRSILSLQEDRSIFMVQTIFEQAEENIRGRMYLVLSKDGKETIKEACGKILKSLE